MQSNVVPLSSKEHANVKLVLNKSFEHIKEQHMAPVIVHEVMSAASELPVVFVKNGDTGQFLLVTLFGLQEKENLLVKDGQWDSPFIPAGLTHYPLSLVPHPEDKQKYSMTIDMASNAISDEGEAIFNEDGSESEQLATRRQALENYYKCAITTRDFIDTVVKLELLDEQTLSFEVAEQKRSVNGIYVVNEQKLNELTDEQYLDLRKKGYINPIIAHIISLKQAQRLLNRAR
ncbi:SapC family protein [Aliikangiella sp. IMCC44632]